MLELFQTEWCPASHRVRQRLTELGIDYVIRQVPVDADARTTLYGVTGARSVPALVLDNGNAVVGEADIRAYLGEHFDVPPSAEAHRAKAAKARRRLLEEECECLQPVTH
jgi:glutathione S-transferase